MSPGFVPILAYHTVQPRGSILSVSPEIFEWQMRWLHEHRFRVLPLSELAKILHLGKSLPWRAAAITFDDGFLGVHQHAFPVLKRFGFPATVFIVAGYCGRENGWPGQPASIPRLSLAGWDLIKEMDRAGMEIGSHTLNHPRLDRLTPNEAENEIIGSKQLIEERMGHDISLFAFPYGHYNDDALTTVKRAYTGAVTTRLEMVKYGGDPYQMGRVDTYYLQSPFLFRMLSISGTTSVYLWIRKILHQSASRLFKRAWA